MELTVNIIDENRLSDFLEVLKKTEYVEILTISQNDTSIPEEHKVLLEQRLKNIAEGKTTFKSWDVIKQKYANKSV